VVAFRAFERFFISQIAPVSPVTACWRCKTKDRVSFVDGPASGSATFSACREAFLGLSWTEMVVPNLECLLAAVRAMERLDSFSAASSLWREFDVVCAG